MSTDHYRAELVTDCAERLVRAFHLHCGLPVLGHAHSVAVMSLATLSNTDEIGGDVDDARETATATLIEQNFRSEAVALFLDDLCTDALRLARDLRA